MGLIFLPRRPAMIVLLILGVICLVDGINKKDTKEILIMVAILIYATVSLATGKKKDPVHNGPVDKKTTNTL